MQLSGRNAQFEDLFISYGALYAVALLCCSLVRPSDARPQSLTF